MSKTREISIKLKMKLFMGNILRRKNNFHSSKSIHFDASSKMKPEKKVHVKTFISKSTLIFFLHLSKYTSHWFILRNPRTGKRESRDPVQEHRKTWVPCSSTETQNWGTRELRIQAKEYRQHEHMSHGLKHMNTENMCHGLKHWNTVPGKHESVVRT